MLDVVLLGSSGTTPLPGRPLASMAVVFDQYRFLVDCGEGTQCGLRENKVGVVTLDAVFITHGHSDHLLGLAGLLETMNLFGRTKPLLVVVPNFSRKLVEWYVRELCSVGFDVLVYGVRGSEEVFDLGKITVTAFALKHNISCYGYTFQVHRVGQYAAEQIETFGLSNVDASLLQLGYTIERDGCTLNQEAIFGKDRKGVKVVYATDTLACRSLAEQLVDADLAVLEGMWSTAEKASDNATGNHSSCEDSIKLANEAGVGELWLTHFGPSFPVGKKCEERLARQFHNLKIGYSGLRKTLMFK